MNRYEVTFERSDLATLQRRRFDDKEDAIRFAKHMAFKANDLYLGGVTASNVKLWAITETRHDITERLYLEDE